MHFKIKDKPKGDQILEYSLLTFRPKTPDEQFPLLLALHGTGGDGREYLDIWRKEAERRRIMVLCPTLDRPYRDNSNLFQVFYDLVNRIRQQYPVDKDRVSIAGVSSGALIAKWILLSRPGFWRRAVFIATPTGEDWENGLVESDFPPVLFFHGKYDEQYDVNKVKDQAASLSKKGVKVTLYIDQDGGHEHRSEYNSKIFDWIEKNTSAKT